MKIIKQLSQENKKMETELNNGILNLKEKKMVVDDTLSKEIRMEYGKNFITIILIIQLVIMNRDNVTFLIGQYNNAKNEKESQQEIIGGCNHNENQIKIDEQIDLHQIMDKLFIRVYIKIGRKIKNGILRIEISHQSFGGGLYDSEGRKNEQWIELNPNFSFLTQICYKGMYENGKKMVNGKFFQIWIKIKDNQEKEYMMKIS
ncbi:unnamed protein product [Paramecium primaurelia]|uniref:Uncharacterized protein n=1 Tax=Paramecium primaurelia TaxID=5886 RepID=A0A8S1LIR6_PARPR|nr:unnamed protein product [Paramecium primaurelia]